MWTNIKRKRLTITCLFLATGTIMSAGLSTIAIAQIADPENIAQVAMGKIIYEENCASCHGGNLQGQPNWRVRKPNDRLPAPPHDETGHTWHHPDEILFGITKMGISTYAPAGYKSDMPAFKDALSDEEIWAVLAFIKSRWPKKIQTRQRGYTRRAK